MIRCDFIAEFLYKCTVSFLNFFLFHAITFIFTFSLQHRSVIDTSQIFNSMYLKNEHQNRQKIKYQTTIKPCYFSCQIKLASSLMVNLIALLCVSYNADVLSVSQEIFYFSTATLTSIANLILYLSIFE